MTSSSRFAVYHLDRYRAEQVCPFKAPAEKDGPRFVAEVVKRGDGRRTTWKAPTDKSCR
jgi:hypothetical protein